MRANELVRVAVSARSRKSRTLSVGMLSSSLRHSLPSSTGVLPVFTTCFGPRTGWRRRDGCYLRSSLPSRNGVTLVTDPKPSDIFDANYPACRVLNLIGNKWTPIVLYCLSGSERDGLVERTVYRVVPPKTEYRLTEGGIRLHEPVAWSCRWAAANKRFLDEVLARRLRRSGPAAG
jgi:DNA-binding HxlR family transcriptional regulator